MADSIDTTSPSVRRHWKHFLDGIAARLGQTTFAIADARRHERPLLRWMSYWIGVTVGAGEGVGASAGAASASGVGASIAEAVGASAGIAAFAGVGASIHEAAGSSAGVASVSGAGASTGGGITIPVFFHHYSQQRNQPVQTLRQSTASQSVLLGPFVDSADGVTAETGLTIANTDIRLSKNGGNMAAKNSGGGTHDENGWYTITLDATDTDTVGRLQGSCVVAGALPVHFEFQVVEEAVYDESLASGADGVFSADIVQINASADTLTKFARSVDSVVHGTAGSGGTTTTLDASSLSPASTEDDQFINRRIYFPDDTTTAALRGQSALITGFVHSTQIFTYEALTEANVSGDTFTVV